MQLSERFYSDLRYGRTVTKCRWVKGRELYLSANEVERLGEDGAGHRV